MLVRGQPFVKRISMPLEFRRDITLYGRSNLYPQMVEQILFRSAMASSAVNSLTDFTVGEGWTDNGDLIVNRSLQTMNDVLMAVSGDLAIFNGFAFHFNVNELLQITEITPVDFKTIRYGLPDDDGIHFDVKINRNWENDTSKTVKKFEMIDTFPLWAQRDRADIDNVEDSNGFILYFTNDPDQYPRSTLDPVLDSAQTDAEIQMFELGNIQNGFLGASIFKHPGKIAGAEERRDLEASLQGLQGAANANSIMIVENAPDAEGDLIESLAANNNDRLFELTAQNVISRILANYSQPYPISGIQPPNGGIFNEQQVQDATVYYNAKTRGGRLTLSRVINQFMEFWHEGAMELGEIMELKFDIKQDDENTDNQE